ncbi:MAG TPA: hypothetical protein VFK20_15260, partial [Vicinamibacterales bacterium]|nr:hypothetical protein [Vicinamibacterales bacterium]
DRLNVQDQQQATWPNNPVVARAYLDQLTRSRGISADRAGAVKTALDRNDRAQLATLAGQLEQDAASASGIDARRLKALAAAIR